MKQSPRWPETSFDLLWIAYDFLTFKAWRMAREARRRRANYEAIKAIIVERHLEGFGGAVLPKKYGPKDLACFTPPMYQLARTEKNEPVICWRKELMTVEVGEPRTKTPVQIAEQVIIKAIADECH